MSPAQLLRLRLRCDPTAPRLARKALAELDEITPVRDDALLVASELATSAVLDSGGPDNEIELLAEVVPDGLRIAVINPNADGNTASTGAGPPPPDRASLRIVRAVARRWGRDRAHGEQVWAVLAM